MLVITRPLIVELREGTTTPTTPLSLAFSRAKALGLYPLASAAFRIFSLVSSFT